MFIHAGLKLGETFQKCLRVFKVNVDDFVTLDYLQSSVEDHVLAQDRVQLLVVSHGLYAYLVLRLLLSLLSQ